MRAHSVGVEATIEKLTPEEIKKLSTEPLTGMLRFYEVNSEDKIEIPFELRVIRRQKEFVKVNTIPRRVYFGDAEKIIFSVNSEYYQGIKEKGAANWARFFSGAGRLRIYSSDYKPY